MSDEPSAARPRRPFDFGFAIVAAIALASGVAVWIMKGPDRFWQILMDDFGFALLLLPKIAGGILLATALGQVLPRDRVLALVGPDSGTRGLAIAMVAGAVIPGGPVVTFPLAASLMAAGADLAAGVALVSGWILLGVNRTLVWELSFLPGDFVALRVALTLPVPILLGLALRALHRRRRRRDGADETSAPAGREGRR